MRIAISRTMLERTTTLFLIAILLFGCAKHFDRMTMRNPAGTTVVCKAPEDRDDISDEGRSKIVDWCSMACEAYGFKWVGQNYEALELSTDWELGARERRLANKYVPSACVPFSAGPLGIGRNPADPNAVPECTGNVLKDHRCPD
jgi:hypothetical protein